NARLETQLKVLERPLRAEEGTQLPPIGERGAYDGAILDFPGAFEPLPPRQVLAVEQRRQSILDRLDESAGAETDLGVVAGDRSLPQRCQRRFADLRQT